jgi:hypothetical protein
MARRARILVWAGLATAALVLGALLWLDRPDWKPLLLFAAVVGVAARGWTRGSAPVASRVDAPALDADAPTPKEPVG